MAGERYKMATMARLTGLAPVLLRAWERRHDLLRPDRTEGGHRLYTEDDLRVLRRVQRLLAQGRSIGEVEALGRPALLAGTAGEPGSGAGSTSADVWREELVQAGLTVDAGRGERALDDAFAVLGPDQVLSQVVTPALRALGDAWAQGTCSVAGEHLVSGLVAGRLHRLLGALGATSTGSLVICACLPDEEHALGALVVAYWLARRAHRVTWLGPSLPLEDLEAACDRLAPADVFLSVTRRSILEAHAPRLAEVARRRPDIRFHVGGAGASAPSEALRRAGVSVSAGAALEDLGADAPRPARPRRRTRR